MNKFYIEIKTAKSGKSYPVLMCDTGFRQVMLTFDVAVISELADLSVRKLCELEPNTIIDI